MILLHPTRSQKCPMVGHSPAPMDQGKGVGGQRLRELRRATSHRKVVMYVEKVWNESRVS